MEDALLYDPRVASFNVRTEAKSGAVTLRGTVDNLMAKRAAEQDARNVVGVWPVQNRLKVRPDGEWSDEAIETKVEIALIRDPYIEKYEISVHVYDGTAHLYGNVDSQFERMRADDLVSRVAGVVDVENNLDIKSVRPYRYDPYIDPWSPYQFDWYRYQFPLITTRSDLEIRDEIVDELWWSPFVDRDQVDVTVRGGVATLTGEVDSRSEYLSATENAYEGGAVRVINNLQIDSGNY